MLFQPFQPGLSLVRVEKLSNQTNRKRFFANRTRNNSINPTNLKRLIPIEHDPSCIPSQALLATEHAKGRIIRKVIVVLGLFCAECTIGMVWGLTPLIHYGSKALRQYGNKL